MRKTMLLAIAAVAVLGVFAGSSVASGQSMQDDLKTLVAVQRAPQVDSIDLGTPGPSRRARVPKRPLRPDEQHAGW